MGKQFIIFVLAVAFGVTLSRSGAADYDFVQKTFLFEDFQLYGIMGVAVALLAPALLLLRRFAPHSAIVSVVTKPVHKGNVIGGLAFGVGWSITGMCPGPILVNIGEGKLYALAAFLGVICGTYLLGFTYPGLAKKLRLPSL